MFNHRQVKAYILFFIIVSSLFVRLYNLDSPIIGIHSWKQSCAAMIARNYYRGGFNLFYPQVDYGGGLSVAETGFPIHQFIIAIFYQFTGVNESVGRLVSIFFSLFAIFFLYLLVRDILDEKIALWSCFFYSFLPLNVYYGRAFMSESLLIFSMIAGVYYFNNWLDNEERLSFLLSAVFICLACLIKPQTLYIGLPLVYLSFLRFGWKIVRKKRFWLYIFLVSIPVCIWYLHASEASYATGISFGGVFSYGSKWGDWELVTGSDYWIKLFSRLGARHFTAIGSILFLTGLAVKRKKSSEMVFDCWIIAMLVYFFLVGGGNQSHEYYQLPLMIPGVVFMAKLYSREFRINRVLKGKSTNMEKLLLVCLVFLLLSSSSVYRTYMSYEDTNDSIIYKQSEMVRLYTKPDTLIISASSDPTVMYLSDRKGWKTSPESIDIKRINYWRKNGASYLIGLHRDYKYYPEGLKSLLSNEAAIIFNNNSIFILNTSQISINEK